MKDRQKVAFIINSLSMGGAETMLCEQVRAMDKNCFEVWIVTILPHSQTNILSRLPHDVKHVAFDFKSILDISSFYKLWSFLKKEKIYAVITGLFDANLVGRLAALLARVPVILSYEHNIYADKKRWQIIADQFLARFTKKILVGSKEVLEFTSKQEHLSKEKFQLNYNSIPLKLGRVKEKRNEILRKYSLPENKIYIVTAGSLTPQKAHSYLIDATYKMKQEGIRNFVVLIFGKGKLKDELLKQIQKLNLYEEVKLMGIAPVEDIMAMSDIFTLPSLWEGLSLALLEAMDARSSIVATKVSGTNEALENEVSALLVDPGESGQLADALSQVVKDHNLREKLAQNVTNRVKQFSIEKNVKVIENLILAD